YGVTRIYSPHDGQGMGLPGMIADMIERARHPLETQPGPLLEQVDRGDWRALSRLITGLESGAVKQGQVLAGTQEGAPVLGITGTGGAGKSSLTDEIVRRFRLDQGDAMRIAVIAVDPSRRKTG